MDKVGLLDAAEALRRTARDVRARRQQHWLTTAIELEELADKREAEAAALV